MNSGKITNKVAAAFVLVVLLGGSNSVAIRIGNAELAPLYGASLRLSLASIIFWILFFIQRRSLPEKKDTLVLVVNGFLSTGAGFACLYYGLQSIPANLGTVIISLSPLFTSIFAYLHGLEKFRWQALAGGLIAVIGMSIAVNAQLGGEILFLPLIALVCGALVSAEGNVILKMYSPNSDSITMNGLSLSAGAVFLILASLIFGEAWTVPSKASTWLALTYLVFGGSVLMFYFFVYALTNWTVSGASFSVLLFPIVATTAGSLLVGELAKPIFILGGAIVLIGVWFAAFYNPRVA